MSEKEKLRQAVLSSRTGWGGRGPKHIEPKGPGDESVWDYPRPPIIDDAPAPVRVTLKGHILADTKRAKRIKETASPPTIYIHPDDCDFTVLKEADGLSICEWKGKAQYFDIRLPDSTHVRQAAWSYPDPFEDAIKGMEKLANWLCFYPSKAECYVGDERVTPQPGQFYGGWVTKQIKGPFKGEPGTGGW
ncbi:MAG: DUF427 domain-containing protein [Pseudomonadota bacterium]